MKRGGRRRKGWKEARKGGREGGKVTGFTAAYVPRRSSLVCPTAFCTFVPRRFCIHNAYGPCTNSQRVVEQLGLRLESNIGHHIGIYVHDLAMNL